MRKSKNSNSKSKQFIPPIKEKEEIPPSTSSPQKKEVKKNNSQRQYTKI